MTILFEDFSSDEDVYEQTIIKVVMLGQSGSGKTSIVLRFIKDTFTENPKTTVGANFFIRKIVIDKKPLCVRVWDTSGQERFNSLIPLYYRNANIAILVTDIKDNSSLTKIKYWVNEMKETVKQIPIIGIAINKTDQYDETLNSQTLEQIQEYGKSLDAVVLETSAKNGEVIERLVKERYNSIFPSKLKEEEAKYENNINPNNALTTIGNEENDQSDEKGEEKETKTGCC